MSLSTIKECFNHQYCFSQQKHNSISVTVVCVCVEVMLYNILFIISQNLTMGTSLLKHLPLQWVRISCISRLVRHSHMKDTSAHLPFLRQLVASSSIPCIMKTKTLRDMPGMKRLRDMAKTVSTTHYTVETIIESASGPNWVIFLVHSTHGL